MPIVSKAADGCRLRREGHTRRVSTIDGDSELLFEVSRSPVADVGTRCFAVYGDETLERFTFDTYWCTKEIEFGTLDRAVTSTVTTGDRRAITITITASVTVATGRKHHGENGEEGYKPSRSLHIRSSSC
jgi:hypothetical protein